MRPVAIPTLLIVALAGLAVIPSTTAAPPAPDCNGTIGGGPTVGPVTVFVSPPCYDVYVDAMSCPLTGSWKDTEVQNVGVHVYTCDSVETTAAQVPPCTCPPPPKCSPIYTVGPLAEVVSVTVTSDCRVIVSILPRLVACRDPLDGSLGTTVGKVTVIVPCGDIDQCEIECYPASATLPVPPVCGPTALCTEPECPWPMGGEVHQSVGPVAVDNDDCGPQDLCSGPLRCTNPLDRSTAIPPVCIEREVEQGAVHAGYSTCYDEFVEVVDCSGGGAQGVHYYNDVGPAYVRIDYCLPHMPPPAASTAAVEVPNPCGPTALCTGPECPAQSIGSSIDHENSLTVNQDCSIDLITGKGQICVGAWSGHDEHQVGPVTWDRYYCDFPGGDPIEIQTASTGPCGAADPQQRCPAPVPMCSGVKDVVGGSAVDVDVSPSCQVLVSVDVIDCLWGESWVYHSAGPLTVRYTTCDSGADAAASAEAPPCTCPPPQPLCRPINQAIADNDDAVDFSLTDSCKVTVVVDLTEIVSCIYGGETAVGAGPVTVIYPDCESPCSYDCQPPVASMADPFPTCIRDCSPLPSEACALRDATPSALVHPLWGYDCTLDVHTACTGGASGSTDARIAFIDVSLARCSGGPDWS